MARIEAKCSCTKPGCACEFGEDTKWVDAVTEICRPCEMEHGHRWGHNTAKAEEAHGQGSGEANL